MFAAASMSLEFRVWVACSTRLSMRVSRPIALATASRSTTTALVPPLPEGWLQLHNKTALTATSENLNIRIICRGLHADCASVTMNRARFLSRNPESESLYQECEDGRAFKSLPAVKNRRGKAWVID